MRGYNEPVIEMVTTKCASICRCDRHSYPKTIPKGTRALRIYFATNKSCVAFFCPKCIPHMIEQMNKVIKEHTEKIVDTLC